MTEWGVDKLNQVEVNYLTNYLLSFDEYYTVWQPLKDNIFRADFNDFPDMAFKEEFVINILKGGLIFDIHEFNLLITAAKKLGNKYFVIVENNLSLESPLMMKYPIDISWQELLSGGDISMEIFKRPIRNYFIFGDSSNWGKYSANDFIYPFNVIGFKKEFSRYFNLSFLQSDEDRSEILKNIPPNYQTYLTK